VEPDESGLLIANATAAARLSPVGVVIAKGMLEQTSLAAIKKDIQKRFRGIGKEHLEKDLNRVQQLLNELAKPTGNYPIDNLEDAAITPGKSQLLAPLEANMRLGNPTHMLPLLQKLWEVGIPHLIIQIPDNPDPQDLVRVVTMAEEIGLICGVSGRATDIIPGNVLDIIVEAGVDHLTAFYASANPDIHDAYFGEGDHAAAEELFKRTESLELADVGHIPLTQDTVPELEATLEALLALQVPNARFYALATELNAKSGAIPAQAMRQVASQVEEDANEARVRYLWEPPIHINPEISLVDQVRQGPRCASDFAVRITQQGDVIPPRGPFYSAGNLLTDSWEDIWHNKAFQRYRERLGSPTRCVQCPGMAICAADCPAEIDGWTAA